MSSIVEEVILVDKNDQVLGKAEKIATHVKGDLHRAFSIFIFDRTGRLLIQKRARTKYHSGGLWSNTCCSHPRPEEDTHIAAHRRLKEEMGFDCDLKKVFELVYKAELDNNLIEHEYDHIFIGQFADEPVVDSREVEEFRWIGMDSLIDEVAAKYNNYTYWLRIALGESCQFLKFLTSVKADRSLLPS